jgi:HPt (histidine-containing phosphotransfer) domain-containing protein
MIVEEFQKKLAALRRDFREKAPDRVAEIEFAWARLRAPDAAEAAWGELIALAHGLSGSSLPMGYPALGAAARELEQAAVLRRRESAAAPSPSESERFERLVARLRQALD